MQLPPSKLRAIGANPQDVFRRLNLQRDLSEAVGQIDLGALNRELAEIAPPEELRLLASLGIRGESLFPVPVVLRANPKLLGHYRLLLGYSQKEFFRGELERFAAMEKLGKLTDKIAPELIALCPAVAIEAATLVREDLTPLLLVPQLRRSHDAEIEKLAPQAVFDLVQSIVAPCIYAP